MKGKRMRFYRIIIAGFLVIFANLICYSQETKSNKFNTFLEKIENNLNAENSDFYFVFWITEGSCNSCLSTFINSFHMNINMTELSYKTITLLESKNFLESRIQKRNFKTNYFIIDTGCIFRDRFIKGKNANNIFMLINKEGKVLYEMNDFNKNDISDYRNFVNFKPKINYIHAIKKTKLLENDSIIISGLSSVSIINDSVLYLCDVNINRVLVYSMNTGQLKRTIKPPEEYKFKFADFNDPFIKGEWLWLDSTASELVTFNEFFINGKDTLAIIHLFTSINKINDTTSAISKGRYFFKYNGNTFSFLHDSVFENDSVYLTKIKILDKNNLLCKKINPMIDDTINPYFSKCNYQFVKYNYKTNKYVNCLSYDKINPNYQNKNLFPNIDKYSTNGNNGILLFDNTTNKILLFENETLKSSVDLTKQYSRYGKLILKDLKLFDDLFYLFYTYEIKGKPEFLIQVYNLKSELVYEGIQEMNEKLLELFILDTDMKYLRLLKKCSKERWIIDTIDLNLLLSQNK